MKKVTINTEDTSQNMVARHTSPHLASITKLIVILGVVSLFLSLSRLLNEFTSISLVLTFAIGLIGLISGIILVRQMAHKSN